MINSEQILISFGAGMGVFLNPCGLPMLPPFIASYLARQERGRSTWIREALRGLKIGIITSTGFIVFFASIGLVLAYLERRVSEYMPWVGVVVGIGLVVLGVLILVERGSFSLPLQRAAETMVRRPSQGALFFFFYGISYSIVALGCTWPFFLMVINQASTGGILNGVVQFAAYSLGMSLLMVALAVMTALYKGFIYKYLGRISLQVRRASAIVLILAGGYIVYYQLELVLTIYGVIPAP